MIIPLAVNMSHLIPSARRVACLVADDDTDAALRAYATMHGFDLGASFGGEPRDPDRFVFHLTLFASENEIMFTDVDMMLDEPVTVTVTGFDALGATGETPVLSCVDATGDIDALRAALLDGLHAIPTYDEFRPHVSLSYAWDGTPALATLPLPDFPLIFDRFTIHALDA